MIQKFCTDDASTVLLASDEAENYGKQLRKTYGHSLANFIPLLCCDTLWYGLLTNPLYDLSALPSESKKNSEIRKINKVSDATYISDVVFSKKEYIKEAPFKIWDNVVNNDVAACNLQADINDLNMWHIFYENRSEVLIIYVYLQE